MKRGKTSACRLPAWLRLLLIDPLACTAVQVDDDDNVTLIDFPQMVSVSHENGKELFDRDMECIIRYTWGSLSVCSTVKALLWQGRSPALSQCHPVLATVRTRASYTAKFRPGTPRSGPPLHSGPIGDDAF